MLFLDMHIDSYQNSTSLKPFSCCSFTIIILASWNTFSANRRICYNVRFSRHFLMQIISKVFLVHHIIPIWLKLKFMRMLIFPDLWSQSLHWWNKCDPIKFNTAAHIKVSRELIRMKWQTASICNYSLLTRCAVHARSLYSIDLSLLTYFPYFTEGYTLFLETCVHAVRRAGHLSCRF